MDASIADDMDGEHMRSPRVNDSQTDTIQDHVDSHSSSSSPPHNTRKQPRGHTFPSPIPSGHISDGHYSNAGNECKRSPSEGPQVGIPTQATCPPTSKGAFPNVQQGAFANTQGIFSRAGTHAPVMYVQVVEEEGDDALEVPCEPDGSLLLTTLQAQFVGCSGLRYRYRIDSISNLLHLDLISCISAI